MIPAGLMNLRLIAGFLVAGFLPGAEPLFESSIEPLLRTRCWQCHGEVVQLGRLKLSSREAMLAGGEHGVVIVPGKPEQSRLFRMVAGLEKPTMPMGGVIEAAEVEAVRKWIAEGAVWGNTKVVPAGDWWAFKKPVRPLVPAGLNPVDYLVGRRRGSVAFAGEASRNTLVRRAYLDLIGLPPTPAQVFEFVEDRSTDAWSKLVERLLASPHYGERWGRHWLDLARYADSNGYEHDFDRPNAWRYRDYVISSFNADKPFDRFLVEQLAGDEMDRPTPETLTATGFLRSHAKVGYREKDNPEFRHEYLDDMIATIGRGVMGLTVQCARCHDHKFDPIAQKDYYRLQASLFGYVEVDHALVPSAEHKRLSDSIDARIRPLRMAVREIEAPYRERLLPAKYARFPENVKEAIRTPEAQRTPGQALLANQVIRTTGVSSAEIDRVAVAEDLARKRTLIEQITAIEKERPAPLPVAMGITDGDYRSTPDGPGDEPAPGKGGAQDPDAGPFLHEGPGRYQAPPSYFLIRGDVQSKGPRMEPGFPAVLVDGDVKTAVETASGKTSGRRLALGQWLGSAEHPVTARVMVNRIWHHHFGAGIVKSIDNFGKMGDLPSNLELLDWLATEFVRVGWSVKQMHRVILSSATYRMDSRFEDAASAKADARNESLWRFPVHRLEAESVRDSILAAAGTLNAKVGGPAVFPVLQPEVLSAMTHGIWNQDKDGPEVWRRSVYVYRKRGLPFPMFEVFDLPDQNVSCGARNTSTVPTQALTLLNNDFVLSQSKHFGRYLEESRPGDRAGQVELAYLRVLARRPNARELELGVNFLAGQPADAFAHVLLNLNEFVYIQ